MEDDKEYWEHQRPGLQKTLCAWGIVLALLFIIGAAQLVWPGEPARVVGLAAIDADLVLRARRAFDKEHYQDPEPDFANDPSDIDVAFER